MKFRKRPVVVDAVRWTGSNVDEVVGFAPIGMFVDGVLYVTTLEGTMRADLGDWIIRGVKGEYYPCKPDVFERTYEVADEATPATAWNSPDVVMAKTPIEVRTSGRDSGRNLETALAFLLTRVGSWTDARWDQHLRHEFGDELANQMIAALKKLSGLE